MNDKVSGYALLLGGIAIMVFSVIHMLLVFTNNLQPFTVFTIPKKSSSFSSENILQQLQSGNISELQLPQVEVIPSEVISKSLNMTTHFFLMTFIAGVGHKLASLGVLLLKPIQVKVKSDSPDVKTTGPNSA